MKVRDPAAASSRLTRWNSWTDGQSPDGKKHEGRVRCSRQSRCRAPVRTPRGPWTRPEATMSDQPRRAGRDAARARAGRVARRARPARTRGSAACCSADGRRTVLAEGWHRGAGSPHAEVDALRTRRRRRPAARTAVVTLEPCNHTGRTGPVLRALVEAGVRRVVYAQRDPNPVAAGGAATLRDGGRRGRGRRCSRTRRARVNRVWTFAMDHGRPFVTWKFATTLDGRSAAADGTSRWVSVAAPPASTPTGCARCATPCWSAPTPSRSTTRC